MILAFFSNSMIFPGLENAFFIFQVFHDFPGRWEPCIIHNILDTHKICMLICPDMAVFHPRPDNCCLTAVFTRVFCQEALDLRPLLFSICLLARWCIDMIVWNGENIQCNWLFLGQKLAR